MDSTEKGLVIMCILGIIGLCFLCWCSKAFGEWDHAEMRNFEVLLYECTNGKYRDVPEVDRIYFQDDLHEYFYFKGERIAYKNFGEVFNLHE